VVILPLFAATPDSLKTRRYTLDEMRVVATGVNESIGNINIIHLENTPKSSELTLSDILKNTSGLSITTGSRNESHLKIRGFRRENVKIMIDCRQINGGYFGYVSLSEMPMFDVSEVHVLKGAVSPLYGTNSSGGVVNFVTRKPSDESWLTIRSGVKRNNTQSLQLITAHSFELWDYWLNISGYKTDGFMLSDDFKPTKYENGSVRNHSNNMSYDIQSKVNFSLLDIHSVGFSLGYTSADERNVPPSIYSGPPYRQFIDWRRYQFSLVGDIQVLPTLNIKPNVFYDAYDNTLLEFSDPALTKVTLNSILESWTLGSQLRTEYILTGKDKLYHLYKYEKQTYNRKDNRDYLDWTTNYTHLQNTSLMLNHQFSEKWETSVAWGLTQSIRYYKETSGVDRKALNTAWQSEPAFSLQYDDKINYANIAFSRNLQYPTMQQLYSYSRGNLHLLPERAIKSELNFGRKFISESVFVGVENSLYLNHIDGMIDRISSARFMNQPPVKNAGYELTFNTQFFKKLETEHQLGYIKLDMNNDFTFNEIPEWSINNTLSYNIMENLKVSYSVNWTDKMNSPDDAGRAYMLPDRVLHEMGVNWSSESKKYKVAFNVSNIFDLDYQEQYGYPAAGRNFSLALEWVVF
jgi:outer membrane cobalamin receptor